MSFVHNEKMKTIFDANVFDNNPGAADEIKYITYDNEYVWRCPPLIDYSTLGEGEGHYDYALLPTPDVAAALELDANTNILSTMQIASGADDTNTSLLNPAFINSEHKFNIDAQNQHSKLLFSGFCNNPFNKIVAIVGAGKTFDHNETDIDSSTTTRGYARGTLQKRIVDITRSVYNKTIKSDEIQLESSSLYNYPGINTLPHLIATHNDAKAH